MVKLPPIEIQVPVKTVGSPSQCNSCSSSARAVGQVDRWAINFRTVCGAIIGINYYAAVRVSFIGAGLLWNRMELLSIARGARGGDAVVTGL